MAKSKKRDEAEDRPRTQRSGIPIHAWIDEELAQALSRYIDSTDPRVFRTAAVETALKEFLRSRGFWPPKG